jgi:hypothetical protein
VWATRWHAQRIGNPPHKLRYDRVACTVFYIGVLAQENCSSIVSFSKTISNGLVLAS